MPDSSQFLESSPASGPASASEFPGVNHLDLLRSIVDLTSEAVFVKDLQGRYLLFNQAAGQLLGRNDDSLSNSDPPRIFQNHDRQVIESGRPLVGEERVISAGNERVYLSSKAPLRTDDGKIVGLIGVSRDITENRTVEQEFAARRLSEERLQKTESLAHIGSFFLSLDCNELYWSDELYRILGYEPRAIVPNLEIFRSHIHQNDRDRFRKIFEAAPVGTGRFEQEFRVRTLYNNVRWIVLTGCSVQDAAGRAVAVEGTCQDISERRNLEEQLQHSQKMEAIGLLAGGVAHDFNNLLTVITGNAYMLLAQSGMSPSAQESLKSIQDAAHRAAALTRQLLTFGRRQRIEPVILDLNQSIRGVEHLLRRFVGEKVRLELDLAEDLGLIRIDPAQVEQILINLALNSRDALPDGGEFKIVTRNSVQTSPVEDLSPAAPKNSVELYLIDNGTGMTEDVRQRIFEPFFTTKEVGKGTGLGLPVVHGIVEQHAGTVHVQSELGRGTVFCIRFPIVSSETPDSDQDDAADHSAQRTILLVDDDEPVRRIARVTLESQGYSVLEADGAEAALAIVRQASPSIDLLVTDIWMPGIRGRELAVKILQQLPHIGVLFISGFSNPAGVHEALSVPNDFLEKPFTPQELIARVESLLKVLADRKR
jgi:two-component system cell cycle sensor histidine kinase/response regulator CckA